MSDSSSRWGERLVFAMAKPVHVVPANPRAVVQCSGDEYDEYEGATEIDTPAAGAADRAIDRRDIATRGNQITEPKSTELRFITIFRGNRHNWVIESGEFPAGSWDERPIDRMDPRGSMGS